MSLAPATRSRIEALLAAHPVVLFMKGTRHSPRCGFSAHAAGLLNGLVEDYHSVDVLADPEIREGIKLYGNWPTIPQLYVRGELVGGADIISESVNSGELQRLLGLPEPARHVPTLTITDAAAAAIRAALEDAEGDALHLSIDKAYRAQFQLKPASGNEIVAEANGIPVLLDLLSAPRAEGLVIDWVETVQGGGLSLFNPNAPAGVQPLAVRELAERLRRGDLRVYDVRPPFDRERVPFPAAKALDQDALAELNALPKDAPIAFLCHHGNSSRGAAEHFVAQGHSKVFNVEGGIDAWSREVDPAVPRY